MVRSEEILAHYPGNCLVKPELRLKAKHMAETVALTDARTTDKGS